MKQFSVLVFFLFLTFFGRLYSQPYFPDGGHVYNDSVVARIDVFMDADSFTIMNNDLYSETEYTALFVFNDGTTIDTVKNIGIRVRGNTSQTSQKKSFKISFNTFSPGRKFYGEEKLHLNGEHNDPCITRSKLYWEMLESMRVPGPRAAHVEFYINSEYMGLYINVENIDEAFVESRFGNNNGNLYKCLYPADLDYISNFSADYKIEFYGRRMYDLQTNKDEDDYSDLANFISVLNLTSDADLPTLLEKVFNVNSFIRAYAVDVATGNWDDYAYNKNNYYLYYNTATKKFEFIPYDTDNTFGIDWFGIDWGTRNIYSWYNSSLNISLIKRIFGIQEYTDRYSFFMNQINHGLGDTANIFPKIDSILLMIEAYAQADIYRTLDYGWSYNDFLNSYTQPLGGQVTYGLKPFFNARHDKTNNELVLNNVIPIISNLNEFPKSVHEGDLIFISSWVEDETTPSSVQLKYKINNGSYTTTSMFDDGMHQDGLANDEVYGASVIASNTFDTIYYFVQATDVIGQTGREPRADDAVIAIAPIPHLAFNEVMASNTTAVSDNYGEFDDWVEIYNADTFSTFLGDKFLSDEKNNHAKWRLPDIKIAPHGFVLIWCDEQTEQGNLHSSFKLNAASEHIFLYEGKDFFLDSLSWTNQITDVSIGCFPDGVLPIVTLEAPTPGYSNLNIGIGDPMQTGINIAAYPNPFRDNLSINLFVDTPMKIKIDVFDLAGRKLLRKEIEAVAGENQFTFSKNELMNIASGAYIIKATSSDNSKTSTHKKLMKQ